MSTWQHKSALERAVGKSYVAAKNRNKFRIYHLKLMQSRRGKDTYVEPKQLKN